MAVLHGFELVEERPIEELNIQASLYKHVKTGAQVLSIVADDENKTFNITFRTPPADSTGVAHILEHSVLCGSRKYPLKEPFIELVKGSMKTFVNAMTGGEATYYPVASTNLKDFYNLIDVYLDAVLYPLLSEHAFHQEGWRYELESPESEMIYKGIVFNEMKGYYASPDTLLGNYSQSATMPDTIYSHDSGGDPAVIPNLTYQGLVDFHRAYYHPSNARIIFCGDDPPEDRLRLMDEWLREFEPRAVDSAVRPQPRFDSPRTFVAHYPVGEENGEAKKSHLLINWLVEGGLDPVTMLSYDLLAYITLQSPASAVHKALLDSGLGDKVMGGADDGPQMHFYAGLKGIEVGEESRVEAFILAELERLATEGIDPEMVSAALNIFEFRLRENNTGSFPRGLAIGFRALQSWIFDDNPFDTMAFESRMNAVKELAEHGGYFERLLRDGILANKHRVTVVLQPDPAMTERLNAVEVERIATERKEMSPDRIAQIVEETHELRRLQETPDSPEDLAKIPTLTLADLDKRNKLIPTSDVNSPVATVLHHDLFTNGIIYLDLGFDQHVLPFELLKYVPLFGTSLLQLGTQTQDYVRLIQRIGQKTGGVWTQNLNSAIHGSDIAASWFFLRAKALPAQVPDLLDILRDILLTVNFDNQERFRQLVLESKAGYESALTQPAGFVGPRLLSRFGEAGAASEQMGGVSYYLFLRDLLTRVDSDWPGVLAELERIKHLLLNARTMVMNVTADGHNLDVLQPRFDSFLGSLPVRTSARSLWPSVAGPRYEGLTVPTQVNAIGKGANLYATGYENHGSVSAISKYVRTTWIWEQVRMKGGAYGGSCGFDPRSGVFTFSSSQDPNLLSTLEVFGKTGNYLKQASLDRAEITRSVIGAISDMDFYLLPDAKGYAALLRYLLREDDAYRQKVREEVLETDIRHFREFADALDASRDAGHVVVFGPATAFEAARGVIDFATVSVL